MNIEEFVKTALEQIVNAVEKGELSGQKFYIAPDGVDFDLAVTTSTSSSSSNSKSGEARIKIIGGGIARGEESNETNETASRIKFTVQKPMRIR